MNSQTLLDSLCEIYQIMPEYQDFWGKHHLASQETRQRLLAAMDVPTETEEAMQQALARAEAVEWRCALPPVLLVWDLAGAGPGTARAAAIISQRRTASPRVHLALTPPDPGTVRAGKPCSPGVPKDRDRDRVLRLWRRPGGLRDPGLYSPNMDQRQQRRPGAPDHSARVSTLFPT